MRQLIVVVPLFYDDSWQDGSAAKTITLDIFWKMAGVTVASVIKFAPLDTEVHIYSNVAPTARVKQLIDRLRAKLSYMKPSSILSDGTPSFQGGSFYIFDVMAGIATLFTDTVNFLFIDPGHIVIGDLGLMSTVITQHDVICCDLAAEDGESIHIDKRMTLKLIFEQLEGSAVEKLPEYIAGGLCGLSGQFLAQFCNHFRPVKALALDRHCRAKPIFVTAEQLLNYLFWKHGISGSLGNAFIRRAWPPPAFLKAGRGDQDQLIWYISKKNTSGITKMFDLAVTWDSKFWTTDSQTFRNTLAPLIGMKPSIFRRLAFIAHKMTETARPGSRQTERQ